jgi:hypothetical protein
MLPSPNEIRSAFPARLSTLPQKNLPILLRAPVPIRISARSIPAKTTRITDRVVMTPSRIESATTETDVLKKK